MKSYKASDHKGTFFKILETTAHSQTGVMTIGPGEDSGPEEVHKGDQIIYVIDGEAEIEIAGEKGTLKAGDIIIIPAGTEHHFHNNGIESLFLFTVYAPPEY